MFQIIKDKDRLRKLESENNKLRLEKSQLEDALFELAQYVSEVKHGETVPTEDN
jgi:regulator of replication initiation timing